MKKQIFLILLCLGAFKVFISCKKPTGKLIEGELQSNGNSSTKVSGTIAYDWSTVPVGGGGYVTGIVIHPTQANRMYIRTDVGGAYRWDALDERWIQMLGNLSTKVDGIALDANEPDRVYIALNDGVYRSDDRGDNWTKKFNATFDGNGDLRWTGECLAVDPLNSDVVYAGTRSAGLYRSMDEGSSWQPITSVPSGSKGVRTVVIDPSSTVNGRSAKVYVGVPGSGVYRSTDGGTTFSAMAGDPSSPNRMQFIGGKLYVTHTTGVAVWDGSSWDDITPSNGAGKNFCGLAVEVYDTQKIAVCQRYSTFDNALYRSSNGGASWEQLNTGSLPVNKTLEAAWWPNSWFSSATACLAFDPLHHGDLYYTDWFGTWFSSNVWASGSVNFTTRIKGLEETVILTLTAPSSGAAVYSGIADIFGFRHDNVTSYPSERLYDINEGFSIASCETSPANIAILGSAGNDGTGTVLATSSNSGNSWTNRTLPAGVKLGRIAISATDPNKMVYVAGGSGGAVYYTTNKGNSWTASTGAPTGAVGAVDVWSKDFSLAADCVDGNKFYLFKSGFLYASTNGGAAWTKKNSTAIPIENSYLFVAARPGTNGEVWVSLDKNGLYKSTNSGTTFAKVSALSTSQAFAWGAPDPSTGIPTVYSYGTLSGVKAMYRSTDLGASWDRIDDSSLTFPGGVKSLAGDRQVFGRIYVGTGGMGLLYGEP